VKLISLALSLGLVSGCSSDPVAPSPTAADESALHTGYGPTITSALPGRATVGSADLVLTVTGTNFVHDAGSHVSSWLRWSVNGVSTHLWSETTVLSATELRVQIPESLLKQTCTAELRVATGDSMSVSDGAGGYPVSNPYYLQIALPDPPVPLITAISPTSAPAGTHDLSLTVTGHDFIPGAWVRWSANGVQSDLWWTKVISRTEISVTLSASLLREVGTAYLLVENGDLMGVGDGYDGYPKSNLVEFRITAPQGAQD